MPLAELWRLAVIRSGRQSIRRVALEKFFDWLLSKHPHAAEARAAFHINAKTARNPCRGIEDPEPMATKNGKRRGYTPFTSEQVEDLLQPTRTTPRSIARSASS